MYGETDAGWRSIIATGILEEFTDLPYESGTVQGIWTVDILMVGVFNRPRDEIAFIISDSFLTR
ncbi:hypothetical protein [Halostagnicola sp. A-GB9-2]|uniref:hypothetical protein n=1 Tax=Halostagnicola sp. A-GB9-2 TaxID=3048066 RepID=UPI0024C0A1E7|nr:hypothetical protein [Halostagnicola sp. A-GB9-2]MDJ1434560.1 hypothetical protein [Halostagnicola sp. A-GB9-2]